MTALLPTLLQVLAAGTTVTSNGREASMALEISVTVIPGEKIEVVQLDMGDGMIFAQVLHNNVRTESFVIGPEESIRIAVLDGQLLWTNDPQMVTWHWGVDSLNEHLAGRLTVTKKRKPKRKPAGAL